MAYSPKRSDWELIEKYDNFLPKLKENFETALAVRTSDRFDWAYQMQSHVYRDGLFHTPIGLHDAETIQDHVDDLITISERHLTSKEHEAVSEMLGLHDITEAIAHTHIPTLNTILPRDINLYTTYNGFKVDPHEKSQFETVAANIIFDGHPHERALWLEFEDNATATAQEAKAFDDMQPYTKCLDFVELGYSPNGFKTFWAVLDHKVSQGKLNPLAQEIYETDFLARKKELQDSGLWIPEQG